MSISPSDCAQELLEVAPLVMHVIRAEMRRQRTPDLRVPQFRTLAFLSRQAGASLSEAAEHIGLTRPAMSILVDGLVTRKLVARQPAPQDRRRVTLTLTGRGQSLLATAGHEAQAQLANRLAVLPEADRTLIVEAMHKLRPLFAPGRAAEAEG